MTRRTWQTLFLSLSALVTIGLGTAGASDEGSGVAMELGVWKAQASSIQTSGSVHSLHDLRLASATTYIVGERATVDDERIEIEFGSIFGDQFRIDAREIEIDAARDAVTFRPVSSNHRTDAD